MKREIIQGQSTFSLIRQGKKKIYTWIDRTDRYSRIAYTKSNVYTRLLITRPVDNAGRAVRPPARRTRIRVNLHSSAVKEPDYYQRFNPDIS